MPVSKVTSLVISIRGDRIWHDEIKTASNGYIQASEVPWTFSLLPWGKLRSITDAFLKQRNVHKAQEENILCGLIAAHRHEAIALAACAHRLSHPTLSTILESFAKSERPESEEKYLQAFLAASHNNYAKYSPSDEDWAKILIQIHATKPSAIPKRLILEELHNKWLSELPHDHILRTHTIKTTRSIYRKINAFLESCMQGYDWLAAKRLCQAFTGLDVEKIERIPHLKEVLEDEIPSWRCWLKWRPIVARLEKWRALPLDWPLRPLWKLQGPNLQSGGQICSSAWERMITDGRVINWLEANSLAAGSGLRNISNQCDFADFVEELFSTMDMVVDCGSLGLKFFTHLCRDPLGLDQNMLKLWNHARLTITPNAPKFFRTLLDTSDQQGYKLSSAETTTALDILGLVACRDLRTYLEKDVFRLLSHHVDRLRQAFLLDLEQEDDWLRRAKTLFAFYDIILRVDWLEDFCTAELGVLRRSIPPSDSLEALFRLHRISKAEMNMENLIRITIPLYVADMVAGLPASSWEGGEIVQQLHHFELTEKIIHRSIALNICTTGLSTEDKMACVKDISHLSISAIVPIQAGLKTSPLMEHNRIYTELVRSIASIVAASGVAESWQRFVREVMRRHELDPECFPDDPLFTRLGYIEYRDWILDLCCIFGATTNKLKECKGWLERLSGYENVLMHWSSRFRARSVLHNFLTGYSEQASGYLLTILTCYQRENERKRRELMDFILETLIDHEAAEKVCNTVALVSSLDIVHLNRWMTLRDLCLSENRDIAAVQLHIWKSDEDLDDEKKRSLAVFGLTIGLPISPDSQAVKAFLRQQIDAIKENASKLESARLRLKRKDRDGVVRVLASVGIEDHSSPLEDELNSLPNELVHLIEQIDANTVEMHFPVTNVNEMRRVGMGLQRGEGLVVRLTLNYKRDSESICVHLVDANTDLQKLKHQPARASHAVHPNSSLCEGRETRLTYVVFRTLWTLLCRMKVSVEYIYRHVEKTIQTYGADCAVCGSMVQASRYRATLCTRAECKSSFLLSDIGVRLSDIPTGNAVLELLLAATHAAALTTSAGKLTLLPVRPLELLDVPKLLAILDKVPAFPSPAALPSDLHKWIWQYGSNIETLLTWVCNSHCTSIIAAEGHWRIPNMPNVLQFVVLDNPPAVATAFAHHDHIQPRRVLFHGTSMDRLLSILKEGPKNVSSTVLMAHGAALGPGIYMAEDPAVSIGYGRPHSTRTSAFSRQHSEYANKQILLGLEYPGDDAAKGNGIHVAKDATKVLLRYIFLLPSSFKAPMQQHIVPAMLSNYNSLRHGLKS